MFLLYMEYSDPQGTVSESKKSELIENYDGESLR